MGAAQGALSWSKAGLVVVPAAALELVDIDEPLSLLPQPAARRQRPVVVIASVRAWRMLWTFLRAGGNRP